MDCLPDSTDVLWFWRICNGSTVCFPARTCGHSHVYTLLWRFFERIAKTYRREKWNDLLRPLLATWYACAQQLGDVELGMRLLLEMMGHGKLDITFSTCLVWCVSGHDRPSNICQWKHFGGGIEPCPEGALHDLSLYITTFKYWNAL